MDSVPNKIKFKISLLTFSILFVGIALDIYLHKNGQVFSSSGAVVIIYALFVWREEKYWQESLTQEYNEKIAKIKKLEIVNDSSTDGTLRDVKDILTDIQSKLDDEPYDSKKLRTLFFTSFGANLNMVSSLLKVNSEIVFAKRSDSEYDKVKKVIDDRNRVYVKTETFLMTIGTVVWAFGTYIFESVNYFL